MRNKGTFKEKQGIYLNCEKSLRDIAKHLHLTDTQIYHRGIYEFSRDRAADLNEQQWAAIIQSKRESMKALQDEIAMDERIALDARVKAEAQKRKRTETRYDDRGKPYQVVYSE